MGLALDRTGQSGRTKSELEEGPGCPGRGPTSGSQCLAQNRHEVIELDSSLPSSASLPRDLWTLLKAMTEAREALGGVGSGAPCSQSLCAQRRLGLQKSRTHRLLGLSG